MGNMKPCDARKHYIADIEAKLRKNGVRSHNAHIDPKLRRFVLTIVHVYNYYTYTLLLRRMIWPEYSC